jgi:hypothetical protein
VSHSNPVPAPYLTIARILGDPGRLVDGYRRSSATMSEVGRDHGLVLHAAAQTGEGLVIVNLWRSRDGSSAAAADPRRLQVIAEHGLGPDAFRKEHHDVEHCVLFGAPRP